MGAFPQTSDSSEAAEESSAADWDLLQEYVCSKSPAAMETLVRRHLPMVYAVARREMRGDASLAQDIVQGVFLLLMQRAQHISSRVVLAGWLFKVTRFAAADLRKRQARQIRREQEAARMKSALNSSEDDATDESAAALALLDDAIAALPSGDRDLVALKFLQGRSHLQVGQAMRITENAARQRAHRALQRLRHFLSRRGVSMSSDTIGAMLAAEAAKQTISNPILNQVISALQSGSVEGRSAAIAKGALHMLRISMLKTVMATGMAVVLVIGGGVGIVQVAAQIGAAPATKQGSAKEFVVSVFQAGLKGDENAFIQGFDRPTALQEAALRVMARAMVAEEELSDALAVKFGASAQKQLMDSLGIGVSFSDLDAGKETVSGNTAIVDIGRAGPGKIPVVKTANGWKISPAVVGTLTITNLTQMEQMTPPFHQLAAEVSAGKYKTVDEVFKAIEPMFRGAGGSPNTGNAGRGQGR
jgi:RNA polymerase sigma factor (sigma-70 family)